jgi:hypothetical protein
VSHICGVCYQDAEVHPSDCGIDVERCYHFPALCCPVCPCGSAEEAHPELAEVSR